MLNDMLFTPVEMNFIFENAMLNSVVDNPKSVINRIVLVCKQYIYKVCCFQQMPKVGKLVKHIKKWYPITGVQAVQESQSLEDDYVANYIEQTM